MPLLQLTGSEISLMIRLKLRLAGSLAGGETGDCSERPQTLSERSKDGVGRAIAIDLGSLVLSFHLHPAGVLPLKNPVHSDAIAGIEATRHGSSDERRTGTQLRLEDKTQFLFDRPDRDVCRSSLRIALYLFPDPVGGYRHIELRPSPFRTSRERFSDIGFRAGNSEPFRFVVEEPSPARVFGLVRDRDDAYHSPRPYPRDPHFSVCQRSGRLVDWHRALPQYAAVTEMWLLRIWAVVLRAPVKRRRKTSSAAAPKLNYAAQLPAVRVCRIR
jgi:hypothetical protein